MDSRSISTDEEQEKRQFLLQIVRLMLSHGSLSNKAIVDALYAYGFSETRNEGPFAGENGVIFKPLIDHLKALDINAAFEVYTSSPSTKLLFEDSFFNREAINAKKTKLRSTLNSANEDIRLLYDEIKRFSESYIFDGRDTHFWLFVQKLLVFERLPAVSPLGIKDNKAGQRFLANVLPCVGVLGETLVDLGLAVDSLKKSWDPFALAATVLASAAIPTSIYLLHSSRRDLFVLGLLEMEA